MSVYHHGRFDVPRGMFVPRDEDADDDGLAIFEGPEAVLLSVLVRLPTTVDEVDATSETFETSVWNNIVRETTHQPSKHLSSPRQHAWMLACHVPLAHHWYSAVPSCLSSHVRAVPPHRALRVPVLPFPFVLAPFVQQVYAPLPRDVASPLVHVSPPQATLRPIYVLFSTVVHQRIAREQSTASAPIHRSSKMSCLTRSDLDRMLMYLLSNASDSSSCFATRLCRRTTDG